MVFSFRIQVICHATGCSAMGLFYFKDVSPTSTYCLFLLFSPLIPPLTGPYQWCQQGDCCSSVPWRLWPIGSFNVWFSHCWEAEEYDKSSQYNLQDLLRHDAQLMYWGNFLNIQSFSWVWLIFFPQNKYVLSGVFGGLGFFCVCFFVVFFLITGAWWNLFILVSNWMPGWKSIQGKSLCD